MPGIEGTSKLSPYLAFGQIHVETIWEECQKIQNKGNGYRKYVNELGWREFSHSLINYFPNMLKGNLRKEFDNFPWEKNKKNLQAWKKGIKTMHDFEEDIIKAHKLGKLTDEHMKNLNITITCIINTGK